MGETITFEKIGVVGLGYVGLPLAVALAEKGYDVVGFDVSAQRIEKLGQGFDRTREIESSRLLNSKINFTAEPSLLRECTMIMVTVPTPVDDHKVPDLGPVISASTMIGKNLGKGAIVVYESTVYPGVTEEICRDILAKESGLKAGEEFFVGYSPERINPGDKNHTIDKIVKVVSSETPETLERVKNVYGSIITAGIHTAPSIKVAEAAKVIENIQRDINIALMNELAIIFEKMNICTSDVLAASRTKWNFLDFRPGLVGGHCIGVDPYYLTSKAEQMGYHSRVILSGREINDSMGAFIAQTLIKRLSKRGHAARRVGILGVTFKENVPDLRNSKVPDIVNELKQFGVEVFVTDALADAGDCVHEYGIELVPFESLTDLDAIILAVAHKEYLDRPLEDIFKLIKKDALIVDVKSALRSADMQGYEYWSL